MSALTPPTGKLQGTTQSTYDVLATPSRYKLVPKNLNLQTQQEVKGQPKDWALAMSITTFAAGTLSFVIGALAIVRLQGHSIGIFNTLGTIGSYPACVMVAFGIGANASLWVYAVKVHLDSSKEKINETKVVTVDPTNANVEPKEIVYPTLEQQKEEGSVCINFKFENDQLDKSKITKELTFLLPHVSIVEGEHACFDGTYSENGPYHAVFIHRNGVCEINIRQTNDFIQEAGLHDEDQVIFPLLETIKNHATQISNKNYKPEGIEIYSGSNFVCVFNPFNEKFIFFSKTTNGDAPEMRAYLNNFKDMSTYRLNLESLIEHYTGS